MSQGQGKHTAMKESGFAGIFDTSLCISKGGKAAAFPYWHIDLNAGCGWNDKAECWGSPIVFLQEARRKERDVVALFCDINQSFASELESTIHSMDWGEWEPEVAVARGDNAEWLTEFAKLIRAREDPRYAVGSLLCDPNGFKSGFPVNAIRTFAEEFRRIDLILNFNVSLFAKVQGCKENGIPGFDHWPTIPDLIPTFHRKHWMVSNPPGWGQGDRFVIALGRNFDTGQRRFLNFYPLESQNGQEIIKLLRHQQPNQPFLPGIDP